MTESNHKKKVVVKPQGLIIESFGSLFSFMENNGEPWGAKNLKSEFMYANKATLDLSHIPRNFNIEGRLDSECPASWAEFEPELQAHDSKVEQTQQSVSVIQTHLWDQEQTLCEKFPLYNEAKECIGTVYHVKKFTFPSLSHYFKNQIPAVLIFSPPIDIFTEKELDVVFFVLQSMSSKMIARKLNLSHRTIENRLQNIYQKINIHSLDDFIEFGKTTGFDRYIPAKFVHPGCQFI